MQRGWSRAILTLQIEGQLHRREGLALSNFPATLPPPDSELAQQATRDPYLFDFLTLHAEATARDEEQVLAQLHQELLEPLDQRGLEIALAPARCLGQAEETEHVGVLDEVGGRLNLLTLASQGEHALLVPRR